MPGRHKRSCTLHPCPCTLQPPSLTNRDLFGAVVSCADRHDSAALEAATRLQRLLRVAERAAALNELEQAAKLSEASPSTPSLACMTQFPDLKDKLRICHTKSLEKQHGLVLDAWYAMFLERPGYLFAFCSPFRSALLFMMACYRCFEPCTRQEVVQAGKDAQQAARNIRAHFTKLCNSTCNHN